MKIVSKIIFKLRNSNFYKKTKSIISNLLKKVTYFASNIIYNIKNFIFLSFKKGKILNNKEPLQIKVRFNKSLFYELIRLTHPEIINKKYNNENIINNFNKYFIQVKNVGKLGSNEEKNILLENIKYNVQDYLEKIDQTGEEHNKEAVYLKNEIDTETNRTKLKRWIKNGLGNERRIGIWIDEWLEAKWIKFETFFYMDNQQKEKVGTLYNEFLYPITESSKIIEKDFVLCDSLLQIISNSPYPKLMFDILFKVKNIDYIFKDKFDNEIKNILIKSTIDENFISKINPVSTETKIISEEFKTELIEYFKYDRKIEYNQEMEENRNIIIYPPFPSSITNTLIIEYFDQTKGKQQTQKLEFYDDKGHKYNNVIETPLIKLSEITKKAGDDDILLRLYKLGGEKMFPYYIKFKKKIRQKIKDKKIEEQFSAFLKIIESKTIKYDRTKEISIGIDFNSKEFTIFYELNSMNTKAMTFSHSEPIYLTKEGVDKEKVILYTINNNFCKFLKNNNTSIKNMWVKYPDKIKLKQTENNISILEKGTIPITTDINKINELTNDKHIIKNIEIKMENREYIDNIIKHIVTLCMVEAEYYGCGKMNIRWAYSDDLEKNNKKMIEDIFSKVENEYNKCQTNIKLNCSDGLKNNKNIISNGFPKSIAIFNYYIKTQKIPLYGDTKCIINLNYNNTELFFIRNRKGQKIIWRDCIELGNKKILNYTEKLYKKLIQNIIENPYEEQYKDCEYEFLLEDERIIDKNYYVGDVEDERLNEKISLFYSALAFYIGLHINNHNLKASQENKKKIKELGEIILGGDINFFINNITKGKKNLGFIIKEMSFHGVNYGKDKEHKKNDDIFVLFSEKPKKEAAIGILGTDQNYHTLEENNKISIIASDIKKEEKQINWNNSFNELENINNISIDNINLSIIKYFLINFYKNSEKYYLEKIKILKIEEINHLLNCDKFKIKVNSLVEQYYKNNISIPVFFILIEAWLYLISDETAGEA